jgi:zinc protease
MRRGAGPFIASSAVVTAKTDSALIEFFRELNRIRDEKVSDAELERAKNYVALGIPRDFETVQDVASQIETLQLYGLPISYLNSYVPRIMAVTADDVQRVAREYVRPGRAAVVVVGDLQKIEPGLRELKIAPVEIRKSGEFVK